MGMSNRLSTLSPWMNCYFYMPSYYHKQFSSTALRHGHLNTFNILISNIAHIFLILLLQTCFQTSEGNTKDSSIAKSYRAFDLP